MKNILSIPDVSTSTLTSNLFVLLVWAMGAHQLLATNFISLDLDILSIVRLACSARAARSTSRCLSRWSGGWRSAGRSRPSTSARSSGEREREYAVFLYISAVKRSIGFTTGFHKQGEGPY